MPSVPRAEEGQLRRYTAALALLLAGCAATPRGDAENTCNFAFLAGVPMPFGVLVGAAVCTFGLELVPDTEDDEEEEEEQPKRKKRLKRL